MTDLRHVLSPGRIGRLELPHRVVMGAMHLGFEARDDGGAALAAFYAERARGGAGLMVTGGAAVNAEGAGGPDYGVLGDAAFHARLRRVTDRVHEAGGLVALQLFHAGRYARPAPAGPPPVAPSAVYSRFSGREPYAMTAGQVRETVEDFARGAALARDLGFDAVEVMGSEGYLVDQFLSPLTNLRDDEWGGDAVRRARFGVEVTGAVRAAVGEGFPVVFRLTGIDLMDGGTSEEDVVAFARALAGAGADALNVGVGWHESPVPSVQAVVPPGVWTPFAVRVKEAVGDLPVIAGNRVNRLETAEAILAGTPIDLVSMARPFLADADLVAATREGRPVNVCLACNQACVDNSLTEREVSCMVNPRAGRETLTLVRSVRPRRVAVVGGGPAGLQAARRAALAGHRVDLHEAADALGGQFRMARKVPGKADYGETVAYFAAELDRLGVRVHLGRPIGSDDLDLLRSYDGVIVASGTRPRRVDVPGADLPHVLSYPEAFLSKGLRGRVAIVGGGGVAVDLAHLLTRGHGPLGEGERFLRRHGLATGPVPVTVRAEVTLLQRGTRVAERTGRSTRWAVLAELREQGVRIVRGVTYRRITPEGVWVADQDGTQRLVEAETVVVAAGQVTDGTVPALAEAAGVWHRVVGGARDADGLDAVRAFAEGFAAAAEFDERGPGAPEPAGLGNRGGTVNG
ncbi:FAD-dependent oxidoreductase [Streptosporangium saharense]|uniref:oxidoreductase n=1 Tax=Streptosporangium saharense TaxID=1706840 RepID=UPI003677544C